MKKKFISLILVMVVAIMFIKPVTSYAGEITNNSEVSEEVTIIEIEDEVPPLAGVLDDHQKMTWWWLVIVVAVATAGGELIRRRQFKKFDEERNF